MAISKEDVARVKAWGFLRNRGTDLFSGRVVPEGSVFTAKQLAVIAECAEKFGNGKVTFTSRLAAEIPGIPFEKIEEARAFIEENAGIAFGGTGAKIRPVTACKGTTCVYGNIDTHALARELHDKFYIGMANVKLPHKFKIGVGGCPNSCAKPSLNDVGIEGHADFEFDAEKCRGCKKCAVETACPMKAVSVDNGKAQIDDQKCITCGVCIGKCPFEAFPKQKKGLCRIYVGGTWGKTSRNGTPLSKLVKVEDVAAIVEKTMLWYRENGYAKERLGKTIDRIGIAAFEESVFSDDLIKRRDEILAAPIKERA